MTKAELVKKNQKLIDNIVYRRENNERAYAWINQSSLCISSLGLANQYERVDKTTGNVQNEHDYLC